MSARENNLSINEDIQRLVISSPCHFVGSYISDSIRIDHAWPVMSTNQFHNRPSASPSERHAFIVTLRTPVSEKKPGIIIPDWSWFGERISSLLSVYYGKRFDSHGPIQNSGLFRLPDLREFSELCNPKLPFNNNLPRYDSVSYTHLTLPTKRIL